MSRNFPRKHSTRKFPLIPALRTFPLPEQDVVPAFTLMPGFSKRAVLGERIYPFAELFVDPISGISVIERKQEGGSFVTVVVGNFPDLYTAVKFFEFIPQVFDTDLLFTIKITDTNSKVIQEDVSVISDVRVNEHKAVLVNQQFKPFADATFADDATLITAIKYEISGASTVAKTAIPVEVFLGGTHDGVGNSVSLIDTTKNFRAFGIRINEVVKNTTDGSQALVTGYATTTNTDDTLTLDGLTGGTDNDFDAADVYSIEDGDNLIRRAQKFELTLTPAGLHIVTLYITDASVEFSDITNVEVG